MVEYIALQRSLYRHNLKVESPIFINFYEMY